MAAPSAVDSSERGPRHRHAALLGLQLEEEVHGGGAPVRPQRGRAGWADDAAAMASVMSRTWKAIASTQARASWARPAPRVRPVTMPRARGSHHGLPRPVSAGTKVTPPLSGTDAASGPTSAAADDDAEPVAQPLDGRARDEGRPLERVGDAAVRVVGVVAEVPGAADGEARRAPAGARGPALASAKLPVP